MFFFSLFNGITMTSFASQECFHSRFFAKLSLTDFCGYNRGYLIL